MKLTDKDLFRALSNDLDDIADAIETIATTPNITQPQLYRVLAPIRRAAQQWRNTATTLGPTIADD